MLTVLLAWPRRGKQLLAAGLDALCLPLAFLFAIWLRYDGLDPDLLQHYFWLIISVPLVSLPIFVRIGLYRAVIRFIDTKIIGVVVLGVTLSVLALAFISLMLHILGLSRAVFVIYWAGAILYVGASRFLARAWLLHVHQAIDAERVVIYGAGQAGVQLASALRNSRERVCVAFIDDNAQRVGSVIGGIRVHALADLPLIQRRHAVREVLLAMPSVGKAQQKAILERLEPFQLKIKVTPSIDSLVNGELREQDIRDVEIEDLLGRDPVAPDGALLAQCIVGKSVMVTGAGGSIGSELCRQIIRQRPARLVLLELSEFNLYQIEQELQALRATLQLELELLPFLGSVADAGKLARILASAEVETLYHAAAYKHVPLVEHNPVEGVRNNVFGTRTLAEEALRAGVRNFVLISTDKAVRPTNVMGASKRLAELILQGLAARQSRTRFTMVRFGNVLGSSGSVVPLFRKQIMQGGPVTLTHPDITRYFMTIPEAAQLVLQAGAMGEGGDVFVLDMGEPVRIADLARRMIHLSGLEVRSADTPHGQIEIRHVGLRPGEKLFEELLIGDNVTRTAHALIMRATEATLPWSVLCAKLDALEAACAGFDYPALRILLKELVAEYSPQCGIEALLWPGEECRIAQHEIEP